MTIKSSCQTPSTIAQASAPAPQTPPSYPQAAAAPPEASAARSKAPETLSKASSLDKNAALKAVFGVLARNVGSWKKPKLPLLPRRWWWLAPAGNARPAGSEPLARAVKRGTYPDASRSPPSPRLEPSRPRVADARQRGAFLAREEVLAEVPVGGVEDAHKVE